MRCTRRCFEHTSRRNRPPDKWQDAAANTQPCTSLPRRRPHKPQDCPPHHPWSGRCTFPCGYVPCSPGQAACHTLRGRGMTSHSRSSPSQRCQSLASPSPHLEAALTKIKVLPMIPNRTPAGCRPLSAYSSPSSSMAIGPAMRVACTVSKSIDCAHQNRRTLDPRFLTPSIQV